MSFLDRLLGRHGGDVLEQQELAKRAIKLLDDGLTPAEAERELVRGGTDPRSARRTIALVGKVRQSGLHLFDGDSTSTPDGS